MGEKTRAAEGVGPYKLKPCPFCGNEHPSIMFLRSMAYWQVHCPRCDIRFRLGAGQKETIKARVIEGWNRRPDCEFIAQSAKGAE